MNAQVKLPLGPPISCQECSVGRFAVYGPTFSERPDALSTCRRGIVHYEGQRTVMRENEVPEFIYTIFSGWAFRYVQKTDGRRLILAFLVPGDLISVETLCLPGMPLPFSVKTLTPASLCQFKLTDLLRLLDERDGQKTEVHLNARNYIQTMNRRLFDLGRRSAAGRMAQLLLELHSRLQQRGMTMDGRFNFPIRQEHIADALGITPAHVNRTLVDLRQRGLVQFARDEMQVVDLSRLREIAEEE